MKKFTTSSKRALEVDLRSKKSPKTPRSSEDEEEGRMEQEKTHFQSKSFQKDENLFPPPQKKAPPPPVVCKKPPVGDEFDFDDYLSVEDSDSSDAEKTTSTTPKANKKPGLVDQMSLQSSSSSSCQDSQTDGDDIVQYKKKKRNVRGMLAMKRNFDEQGSKGSDSEALSMQSSTSSSEDEEENGGEIEALFDDTLEEIKAQEEEEKKTLHPVVSSSTVMQNSANSKRSAGSSYSDQGGGGDSHTNSIRTVQEVLREVPFFAQFSSEHQEQLFHELQEEFFTDGVDIVNQGDVGDKFYVIVEGEAVVSKFSDETHQMRDLTHIYTGDYFGELVLIYGGERVATVTSCGRTKCMSLSKSSFEKYADIRYFLILQKVPLLAKLNRKVQLEIVKRLKPAKYNQDDVVVKQGDRGDAFFMITRGSALVIDTDEDKIITRLYEGHSFGEMALLSDAPRVATVKAGSSELHCMLLNKEDFKELMSADDFALLLKDESNKIRELRDKRNLFKQMRANSGSFDASPRFSSSYDMEEMSPGDLKRNSSLVSSLSLPKTAVETQQKLKTGKTSGGSRMVNNYILLQQIGKGTFGIVRLCENIVTGEQFAIKIIDKSLFKNKIASKAQSTMEDMRREASIMKKLNHPNVVNLVDVIDDPKADQLFLIQEYCARGAIMEKLEGNVPLPELQARKYFRDVLSGIDYLHAHHIVHVSLYVDYLFLPHFCTQRDIKPMNLLLTSDGVVKIGDFGAARVLHGGSNQTLGIAGTPAFMAPELLGQEASLYDGPLVDLWSCGATLFMLVTGVPPWMADDEVTLAKRVQNDELVFPGTFATTLSPHLRNLLTRLLVKDPKSRMTLTEAMTHEWVTEEDADPMERFVNLQPQLIRINSKRVLFHAPPTSPSSSRKQSSPLHAAYARVSLSDEDSDAEDNPISLLQSNNDTPLEKFRKRPDLKFATTARNLAHSSSSSSLQAASSSVHVVDDDLNNMFSTPLAPPAMERRASSGVDYTQFDVGKGLLPRLHNHHVSLQRLVPALISSSSSKKKKKKLTVVDAFVHKKRLSLRRQTSASSRSSIGSMDHSPLLLRKGNSRTSAAARKLSNLALLGDADYKQQQDDRRRDSVESSQSSSVNELLSSVKSVLEDVMENSQATTQAPTNSYLTKQPIPVGVSVRAKRGHPAAHCGVRFGYAENQGLRTGMEDCIAIVPKLRNPDTFYAGIFDGHNGDMVAKELKARLHGALSSCPEFSYDLPTALRKTCLKLDRAMLHFAASMLVEMDSKIQKGDQQKSLFRTKGGGSKVEGDVYRKAGSTAVIGLVRNAQLTVAWVGDSRAVLCRAGKPFPLSVDHKADREDEKQRIRDNFGTVDRQGRLNGDLAVSRAFGDLQHKNRDLSVIVQQGAMSSNPEEDEVFGSVGTLIALPDVVQVDLTPEDEFMVLASDGVWDVMTNEEVIAFVRFHLYRHGDVRKASVELVDKALEMHSLDNVSAVIVAFGGKY